MIWLLDYNMYFIFLGDVYIFIVYELVIGNLRFIKRGGKRWKLVYIDV